MLRPPDVRRERALALAVRAAARAADEGVAEAAYATVDSPVGTLVAVMTPRGLARLAYEDSGGGVDAVLDDVAARLSPAIVRAPARLDDVRRELEEFFEGRRREFDLAIDWALVRTAFTVGVLRATAEIPFGATSTYREVAAAAGSPAAFRAAGNALGSNPLPIVVPCHRVLASGGGLGGYTGGIERKRRLLAIEGLPAR